MSALQPRRSGLLGGLLCGAFLLAASLVAQSTAPTIASLNPAAVVSGSPGFTLTVTGTNFVSGSVVRWNGGNLPTSFASATQLNAIVASTLLSAPGTALVTVVNPDNSASAATSFPIQSPNVTITTTAIPNASVGVPYSFTLSATGGIAPYTWSTAGNFPSGLALSTDGIITGKPTTLGTFNFTVRASDTRNSAAVQAFSITVVQPVIKITNPSQLPSVIIGQTYSVTLVATGGAAPYYWTAGVGLPPGISFDQNTGAIRGTPTTPGKYTFNVSVTDAAQNFANATFTIVVNPPALLITTVPPLFSGTVGVTYSQQFNAQGGIPPYKWSIASGSTGGLTLDPTAGTLTGKPQSSGTFSFTLQLTDDAGTSVSKDFTLTVNQPTFTVSPAALSPASAGTAYSQTFTAAGGTSPYTWTLTSGSVPGLDFDPKTATLAGTPSTAGTFPLTLTVKDSAGITVTRSYNLVVTAGNLRLSSPNQLPDGTLAVAYSQTITAAGGAPPYTWTANGLPDGLSIDANTGVISGTPNAGGSFGFTIRVTDSARATAIDLFRINITLPTAPNATISGLPATGRPGQQLPFTIALDATYPAAITGQATLSFAPDSGSGDATIQFASGGRTADFTVPTGTTSAVVSVPLAIQTGTVAGTISVSLRLQAGGVDVTPASLQPARIRIDRAAPVIQSAKLVRNSTGFAVEIIGYSTSVELTQATFTFGVASGQTLQNSSVNVPIDTIFAKWYQDPANSKYGSQFFYSQPFTVTGDANAVTPLNVTLTNRIGSVTSDIK